ncbi:hypothetical protein BC828DRAFT_412998 [Blastocladiella britannica]|nr:hypothetical protein BC828DRAFT_412998 [Blastocladiella britannica]
MTILAAASSSNIAATGPVPRAAQLIYLPAANATPERVFSLSAASSLLGSRASADVRIVSPDAAPEACRIDREAKGTSFVARNVGDRAFSINDTLLLPGHERALVSGDLLVFGNARAPTARRFRFSLAACTSVSSSSSTPGLASATTADTMSPSVEGASTSLERPLSVPSTPLALAPPSTPSSSSAIRRSVRFYGGALRPQTFHAADPPSTPVTLGDAPPPLLLQPAAAASPSLVVRPTPRSILKRRAASLPAQPPFSSSVAASRAEEVAVPGITLRLPQVPPPTRRPAPRAGGLRRPWPGSDTGEDDEDESESEDDLDAVSMSDLSSDLDWSSPVKPPVLLVHAPAPPPPPPPPILLPRGMLSRASTTLKRSRVLPAPPMMTLDLEHVHDPPLPPSSTSALAMLDAAAAARPHIPLPPPLPPILIKQSRKSSLSLSASPHAVSAPRTPPAQPPALAPAASSAAASQTPTPPRDPSSSLPMPPSTASAAPVVPPPPPPPVPLLCSPITLESTDDDDSDDDATTADTPPLLEIPPPPVTVAAVTAAILRSPALKRKRPADSDSGNDTYSDRDSESDDVEEDEEFVLAYHLRLSSVQSTTVDAAAAPISTPSSSSSPLSSLLSPPVSRQQQIHHGRVGAASVGSFENRAPYAPPYAGASVAFRGSRPLPPPLSTTASAQPRLRRSTRSHAAAPLNEPPSKRPRIVATPSKSALVLTPLSISPVPAAHAVAARLRAAATAGASVTVTTYAPIIATAAPTSHTSNAPIIADHDQRPRRKKKTEYGSQVEEGVRRSLRVKWAPRRPVVPPTSVVGMRRSTTM